jgi:hypothetical protein
VNKRINICELNELEIRTLLGLEIKDNSGLPDYEFFHHGGRKERGIMNDELKE